MVAIDDGTKSVKVTLTAITGSYVNSVYEIRSGSAAVFGRSSDATHAFRDDHMSSQHFQIENDGRVALISDLGATNGLFVNRERVSKAKLVEGDEIQAGITKFVVEFKDAASKLVGDSSRYSQVEPKQEVEKSQKKRLSTTNSPTNIVEPGEQSRTSIDSPLQSPFLENSKVVPVKSPDIGKGFQSPLDSSSISLDGFKKPAELGRASVADVIKSKTNVQNSEPKDYQLIALDTQNDARNGFGAVLDSIAAHWCIELVLDFKKIRNTVPDCLGDAVSVLDWIPEGLGPAQVNWSEVSSEDEVMGLLPRLCGADACVAFVGKSAQELHKRVQELKTHEVDGFSERNGWLSSYWPSSLSLILEYTDREVRRRMLSPGIHGVLFCAPWRPKRIVGLACESLRGSIQERHNAIAVDRILTS